MKSDLVYLSYYQVMIFMHRIDEMRKESDTFEDEIASMFEKYVIKRAGEIVLFYPQFLLKLIPYANKYCLSKENFEYLCKLTNVNPLNKQDFNEYLPKIKMLEEEMSHYFDNKVLKNLYTRKY